MKCEFIGTSKHYTTGKTYEIKSKFCKVLTNDSANIKNVIAVYNINDPAALYKFENSEVATIRSDDDADASSNVPYRTYITIEDFFKDWRLIEL